MVIFSKKTSIQYKYSVGTGHSDHYGSSSHMVDGTKMNIRFISATFRFSVPTYYQTTTDHHPLSL